MRQLQLVNKMSTAKLHFIGRDAGAPDLIVRWCREQWPEALPQGLVFCVPTSLAFRRLRDALTLAYSAFQGVRFVQPSQLFDFFSPPSALKQATVAEQLCAWDAVFDWLQTEDSQQTLANFLFPGRAEWIERPRARYAIAQQLIKLRATLVEQCLDFAAVATFAKTESMLLNEREQMRWAALEALEVYYRQVMAERALIAPTDVQLKALRQPVAQPQETGDAWHLVVACVSDMMPALERFFSVAPMCDILVQAAPNEADHFTSIGLPKAEYWSEATIDFPTEALRIAETPENESNVIDDFLDTFGTLAPSNLCLGILNRESMPALTSLLITHGMTVFEPDPIALVEQPATRAVQALLDLRSNDVVESLIPLLCMPEIAQVLATSMITLRCAYNTVVEKHRPQRLADILFFLGEPTDGSPEAALKTFVCQCQTWLEEVRRDLISGVRTFLKDVYGARVVNPVKDPELFATFDLLRDVLDEVAQVTEKWKQPSEELLLACLSNRALRPVRRGADCSYEGRLEILWSSAPILVLSGLNEGIFPDTIFEDLFLPNAFRAELGLRSDTTRAARDAYILATATAQRDPKKLCLVFSRVNKEGDWLKPSRLLFRCDDVARVQRAKLAFLSSAPAPTDVSTDTALRFDENPVVWQSMEAPPAKLSSTAIRCFCASPLEYWLTYVMRLKDTHPLPKEVPANDFGTLMHEALRVLKECSASDVATLEKVLIEAFDVALVKAYGTTPDVEVIAARRDAHARLRKVAEWEASSRAEGWITRFVEHDTRGWDVTVMVDSHPLKLYGQIDRIDENVMTGKWRVVDYKTGSMSGTTANPSHYKTKPTLTWHNFQLPIYRQIVRAALHLSDEMPLELFYLSIQAADRVGILPYKDPESEAQTRDALQSVLHAIFHLHEHPLPAEVSRHGKTLLAKLIPTTDAILSGTI